MRPACGMCQRRGDDRRRLGWADLVREPKIPAPSGAATTASSKGRCGLRCRFRHVRGVLVPHRQVRPARWIAGERDGRSGVTGPIGFLAVCPDPTEVACPGGGSRCCRCHRRARIRPGRRIEALGVRGRSLLRLGIPYHLQVFASSFTCREVLDLPGVIRADPSAYLAMMQVEPGGSFGAGINGNAVDWSSADPTIRVLEGAVPDGNDPFEVMVNEAFVELAGRSVGDVVAVRFFGLDQAEQVAAGNYQPAGPRHTFLSRPSSGCQATSPSTRPDQQEHRRPPRRTECWSRRVL